MYKYPYQIDIVRYRSLSEQAFFKVCKARLYITFGKGALSQATQTKTEENPSSFLGKTQRRLFRLCCLGIPLNAARAPVRRSRRLSRSDA